MRCVPLLIFFFGAVAGVQGLGCLYQWECLSVTDNFNYVECRNAQCTCLTNQGFLPPSNPLTALPSTTNKCGCASPKSVVWSGSTPYCVSLPTAVANDNEKLQEARMRDTLTRLYNSVPVAFSVTPALVDSIFAPSAKGRIDPVGSFDDRVGLVEYFFSLAAAGSTPPQSVDIRSIIADSTQSRATVRVNIFFAGPDNTGGTYTYNLTQSGLFTFDSNGLVTSCDLIIHNLGEATRIGLTRSPLFPPGASEAQIEGTFAAAICASLTIPGLQLTPVQQAAGLSTGRCLHGGDQTKIDAGYYTDFNDCLAFMSNTPFGDYGYLTQNSILCRSIHSYLTLSDPNHHCPHAGKFGGGKCVDVNYADYYLKNF